jgi:hypothetical protein
LKLTTVCNNAFTCLILPCLIAITFPLVAEQPYSLTISLTEKTVQIGSQITVKTTLTNTSKSVVTFFDANTNCDYLTEVRDDKHNLAPETDYKRKLQCGEGRDTGANKLVTLKPLESQMDEIIIRQLYDLDQPGDYTIQVTRMFPKHAGIRGVSSNLLRVTVTK